MIQICMRSITWMRSSYLWQCVVHLWFFWWFPAPTFKYMPASSPEMLTLGDKDGLPYRAEADLLQRRYHHKITVDVSSNVRQKKHKTINNVRSFKKKKEWVAGITMKTKSTKSTNKNHKNNLGIRAEDFSPTDLGPCVRRCVCPRPQKWYRWTRHFSEACTVGTGISQVSHKIFINPVTQSTDGEICYDLLSARNRGGFVNGFAWITGSVYQCILHIYI